MLSSVEQTSLSYLSLVERHVEIWPVYKSLCRFLTVGGDQYQQPAKIICASITTKDSKSGTKNRIDFKEINGTSGLEEELLHSTNGQEACRLFLVENICPRTISLLGGHFDIDPQYFADHLNNDSWYRIGDVGKHLTALPSMQKLQEFLRLRFIEVRTIVNSSGSKVPASSQDPERSCDDNNSFIMPDETTTRIPRKAGKILPKNRWNREWQDFLPLLCIRQVVSVWFQEKKSGDGGWNGIVLMDPPFELPSKDISLRPPEYRSFLNRPSLISLSTAETETRESNQTSFIRYLRRRLEGNETLLKAAKSEPFFIVGDLYRVVASNWIVVVEYINRELSTIEYILEKQEPAFLDLEIFLKDLYIHRRRCAKYRDLITEAEEQCSRRGQKVWPQDLGSDLTTEQAKDLGEDFISLQAKTLGTVQRIEKNISLLTALVAIAEGKQQLDENHGVMRLTLLATVFLPFSTIASILGMQGNFAPGSGRFWLFWAVALPLTALIMAVTILYDGFRKPVSRRLGKVWDLWTRRRKEDV